MPPPRKDKAGLPRVQLFLAACNILFVSLFAVLSYHNRLAVDDFFFLGNSEKYGAVQCVINQYHAYSGRWTAYLFACSLLTLSNSGYFLLVFGLVTLCSFAVAVYFLLRNILQHIHCEKTENGTLINYSFGFTCAFFFASFDSGETWFWFIQVCSYLWSILVAIAAATLLLSDKKNNSICFSLLAMAGIFIGGASESFALFDMLLLVILLVYRLRLKIRNGPFPARDPVIQKTAVLLAALLLSFSITAMAPGNEVRSALLPQTGYAWKTWVQVKAFIKMLIIKIPKELPLTVLFSLPWLFIKKQENILPSFFDTRKILMTLLVVIFVMLLPTSFIMSELAPDRALSHISLVITICVSFILFLAGNRMNDTLKKKIAIFYGLLAIPILSGFIAYQYPLTKKYANAYDDRAHYLATLQQKGNIDPVSVKALPSSGWLYPSEISTDTSHFSNTFLQLALRLRFPVRRDARMADDLAKKDDPFHKFILP